VVETALIVVGFAVVAFFLPHVLAGDDNVRVNDI
jgi:hypothetical protein